MGSDVPSGNGYVSITSFLFGSSSYDRLKSQTKRVYFTVVHSHRIKQLYVRAFTEPVRSVGVKYSVLLNSNTHTHTHTHTQTHTDTLYPTYFTYILPYSPEL